MAAQVMSQPFAAAQHEPDIMDIDIDMDIDIPPMEVEEEGDLEEGEAEESNQQGFGANSSLIPAIYNEDPLDEPQSDKIYVRGVDDLHTSDIELFANDHFPTQNAPRIEWIDDTSANIRYPSAAIALEALLSFTSLSITSEDISTSPFELRAAKKLSTHPASVLQVRVAKMGDKKKRGAKDASRYYLMNPDQDPRERMKKEFEANGRIRRGGENGDYTRRRYDDREDRRRRHKDAAPGGDTNGDFAASMYDDNPAPSAPDTAVRGRDLFARTTGKRNRDRSASPGRSVTNSDSINISDDDEEDVQHRRKAQKSRFRNRSPPPRYAKRDPHPFPLTNASKELFPTAEKTGATIPGEGTLHSDKIELFPSSTRDNANRAAASRLKKDLLSSPRSQNHRRSNAMDAKNEVDLSDRFARKSLSEDVHGRNTGKELLGGSSDGLNIRGSAAGHGMSIKGSGGLSIKGAAANTRELFPSLYQKGGNEGKELFSDKIRDSGRRIRADDFH